VQAENGWNAAPVLVFSFLFSTELTVSSLAARASTSHRNLFFRKGKSDDRALYLHPLTQIKGRSSQFAKLSLNANVPVSFN
jgi:hypothetical protein